MLDQNLNFYRRKMRIIDRSRKEKGAKEQWEQGEWERDCVGYVELKRYYTGKLIQTYVHAHIQIQYRAS